MSSSDPDDWPRPPAALREWMVPLLGFSLVWLCAAFPLAFVLTLWPSLLERELLTTVLVLGLLGAFGALGALVFDHLRVLTRTEG